MDGKEMMSVGVVIAVIAVIAVLAVLAVNGLDDAWCQE